VDFIQLEQDVRDPLLLVVEDNRALSDVMVEVLELEGYDTHAIHDGQEALSWLAQSVPAIVMLDINLPNVSGNEILRFMRDDIRLSAIPVFIMTADVKMAETLHGQANIVFTKPIDMECMIQKVKQFCKPFDG
jgi:CheY-like chemotaxis protein